MAKREMQRAVAAHGDSGDPAILATRGNAVARFNARQEFLHEKILVASLCIGRIDVERLVRLRRGHKELADLSAFPQVLRQIECAAVDEHLLVVAEAVEK